MLRKAKWLALSVMSVAILAGVHAARAADKDPAADAKAELKTTIKSGIDLLKDKKLIEFTEQLMKPDEIEKLKKSGRWDAMVASFKKDADSPAVAKRLEGMQKFFEALQDADPKLSEDNTVATYEAPKIEGAPPVKEFHFLKIKDKWYINEH